MSSGNCCMVLGKDFLVKVPAPRLLQGASGSVEIKAEVEVDIMVWHL